MVSAVTSTSIKKLSVDVRANDARKQRSSGSKQKGPSPKGQGPKVWLAEVPEAGPLVVHDELDRTTPAVPLPDEWGTQWRPNLLAGTI